VYSTKQKGLTWYLILDRDKFQSVSDHNFKVVKSYRNSAGSLFLYRHKD